MHSMMQCSWFVLYGMRGLMLTFGRLGRCGGAWSINLCDELVC